MEQVQKYAKHLQKVREEEKALLAREIHDELGQLLVALKMDTGVTTTQYNKAESNEDKEKIKLKLSKHAEMITKAISSARRIMYGLRPVKLEMLGFAGACEDFLEDFSSRYEIECITNIDLDIEKLDEDRSLAMYRILQETMMNIVKHAQATAVEIKYYKVENEIVFEVKDNGVGFTVGKDGREDSYGLLGINERVSLLKGVLKIESSPGNGTRVVVRFPLGER
jgi:signal transduction histidine kinase